jgi:uncharacterized heparinase superfamily protein
MRGAFSFEGDQVEIRGRFWEPEGASDAWMQHIHGFEWLRDLRAAGGEQARQVARGMVDHWIARYHGWNAQIWRPDIAGQRLANWIALFDFYGASGDADFQEKLFDAAARQARHIARVLPGGMAGLPLLHAIKGLIFAGLAFRGRESWLVQGLDLLEDELRRQILSDGGHISRSPSQLVEALRVAVDIRTALAGSDYPPPEKIQHTIDRMAQAVRFFRYADKTLALFNGAQEGDLSYTDAVLAASNARGKILGSLPESGYERAVLGRSVLMMDTGFAPPHAYDRFAHAAPLAFEFVYGKQKVFASCGSHPFDPQWQDVLRGTAAHNALCLEYRNAAEIRNDGHFGRKPRKVTVMREDARDAILIDASHDGYVPVNGITHRRRLLLTDQGHDLRGEESLTCSVGLGRPVEVAIRFHLHPKVLVSVTQGGHEALLRLPGGAGWRFFHNGGGLELDSSLYLGQGSRPRKTHQLVIHGTMESDHALIKWALQREG